MREIERLKRGKSSVDIRKAAAVSAQTHGTSQGPPSGDTSPGRRGKRLLTVDSRSPPPPKNSGACTREDGRFRFSEEISPQQRQRQESQQVAAHASPAAAVEADRASPSSKRAVHWSQVKPISENEVSGSGSVPVNLADGQFDEAKQKEDFQAAVMAWRNGGARGPTSSASSSYSSSTGAGGSLLSGSGGMWNNPLGDQGGAYIIQYTYRLTDLQTYSNTLHYNVTHLDVTLIDPMMDSKSRSTSSADATLRARVRAAIARNRGLLFASPSLVGRHTYLGRDILAPNSSLVDHGDARGYVPVEWWICSSVAARAGMGFAAAVSAGAGPLQRANDPGQEPSGGGSRAWLPQEHSLQRSKKTIENELILLLKFRPGIRRDL